MLTPEELERLLGGEEKSAPGRVNTHIQEEGGGGETSSRDRGNRGRTVKDAARLRDPAFRLSFIRENYHDVDLGQRTVLEILTFTGPTSDTPPPRLLPLDVKEVREEALHMVQRSPPRARIRILKDWEIFRVFKAAYDALTPDARRSLVRRWEARHGQALPTAPEIDEKHGPYPPLFWLRGNPVFWERGGRFWWWAAHALVEDPGFRLLKDGRVWIRLEEGGPAFHS